MYRLEMASYPVREVRFGASTGWSRGSLMVDREETLDLLLRDPRIAWASADLVHPGESARVVNPYDVWIPMVKAEGPGQTYPAVSGRETGVVGQGRTHRLTNLGVVECSNSAVLMGRPLTEPDWTAHSQRGNFFDMSGPRSQIPYGRQHNLCLTMERDAEVSDEDWEEARRAASLRVCDRLAEATLGQPAPEVEVFDTTGRDRSLPRFVHIPMIVSRESFRGPRTTIGPAVYGLTRQSMPWLLQPTEIMDGAITRGITAYQVNNPSVWHLARGHGKDWTCLGIVVGRSNWTSMPEKEVFAHRVAELVRALGAEGAIVTVDIRGARFVETILSVQALEQRGIKTVLMTLEETSEDGLAPPLLLSTPEVVSVVSCGDGAVAGPFPAVERVVGARHPNREDYGEQPGVRGGYGSARFWNDYYGVGRYSGVDF
ncbi:MAG: glycine/sarcosine/betaine reductase component B subunit [Chloroflexota bacterium]